MTKSALKNLILECAKEVRLKRALKSLINETVEEIKQEETKTIAAMVESLDNEVKKIDKSLSALLDDAGNIEVVGCDENYFNIRIKSHDCFDVVYIKDSADREKKFNLTFDDVKKYVKEKLESKNQNYVTIAHNKSSKNSEDKMTNNGKETVKHVGEKAEDQVKNEDDLPTKPYREVEKIVKQDEHKDEKSKYTYPKQSKKEKSHLIKLKGKKLKS